MKERQSLPAFRVIIQVIFFVLVIPFLPLLISEQWDWWEAWVFALIYILSFVISRALAARRNPDILAERSRFLEHENIQKWDKILAPLVGLGGGLIPITAGLDKLTGGSAAFSLPLKLAALFFFVAGIVWGSYALIENSFFSGTVRKQPERGQHVISAGPYRIMRHPGYAGALVTYLATPFFLDSLWTFLPVAFITIVLVIRTALEDRFLQAELEGYRGYAARVRYRLIPGIW